MGRSFLECRPSPSADTAPGALLLADPENAAARTDQLVVRAVQLEAPGQGDAALGHAAAVAAILRRHRGAVARG